MDLNLRSWSTRLATISDSRSRVQRIRFVAFLLRLLRSNHHEYCCHVDSICSACILLVRIALLASYAPLSIHVYVIRPADLSTLCVYHQRNNTVISDSHYRVTIDHRSLATVPRRFEFSRSRLCNRDSIDFFRRASTSSLRRLVACIVDRSTRESSEAFKHGRENLSSLGQSVHKDILPALLTSVLYRIYP